MPPYVAIRNAYRPTSLVPKPYGWTTAPAYNRSDVPSAWADATKGVTSEEAQKTLAYEWLNSGALEQGNNSNPPFTSGASGRLHPLLTTESGTPARILRGFIRRANWEAGDPISKTRLYFMYNPEQITREYVSYLDQQALDPFNTVYQSGNLVAPPSFMNFRFDLFFDRQTEATAANHPGVYVDYQFFDLVVRNVIPQDPNESNNAIPDNGVMMVNPRDITVVFSPQMTVQGRPINAQVVFEKFTHRMTPVRMRISLEMRVVYFGPMLDQSEYRMSQAEFESEVSVPYEEEYVFNITYTNIIEAAAGEGPQQGQDYVSKQYGLVGGTNAQIRMQALQYGMANLRPGAFYSQAQQHRTNFPHSADCSGLVYSCYKAIGHHQAVFGGNSNCESMMDNFVATNWRSAQHVASWPRGSGPSNLRQLLQPGDLLYKWDNGSQGDHVAFFVGWEGEKGAVFDAYGRSANPQVGKRTHSLSHFGQYFNHIVRPLPVGAWMSGSLTNGMG